MGLVLTREGVTSRSRESTPGYGGAKFKSWQYTLEPHNMAQDSCSFCPTSLR